MSKPLLLRKQAKILVLILFLVGLAFLTYLGSWWPAIMLLVGVPLTLWQYLQGRHFDMWVSLFVFGGAFVTVQFDIRWEVFLPVLFSLGGIYIFFREWLESRSSPDEELDEENEEIEEDDDHEEE